VPDDLDLSRIITTPASEIEVVRLRWAWPGWIPLGKLTLVVGFPECCKSTYITDLAARLSRRASMPDGSRSEAYSRNSILFSAEDDAGDTLVPRLAAAGALTPHVYIETSTIGKDGWSSHFNLRDHMAAFENMVLEREPSLVAFDPLSAFVGKTNTWRDAEVRQMLDGVGECAAKHQFALIGVMHFNKSSDLDLLQRIMDSVAFGAAARSVIGLAEDSLRPKHFVLGHIKANLSLKAAPLTFAVDPMIARQQLVGVELDGESEEPILMYQPFDTPVETIRLVWNGAYHGPSIQQLMKRRNAPETAGEEAIAFLLEELKDGPVLSKQIDRDAKDQGVSPRTLREVKDDAGVRARKARPEEREGGPDGPQAWVWELEKKKEGQ
jgi:putative DNA primase/helicase